MPSVILLASLDGDLADAWERQLPHGKVVIRLAARAFAEGTSSALSAVVILDSAYESQLPSSFAHSSTIYVGEPKSIPFEQAKMSGRAKVYMSYADSHTRLCEFMPLVEEIAEKNTMVEFLSEKRRRVEIPTSTGKFRSETSELWDFVEATVENLDSRERLVAEFRRASRYLLGASHAVFFFRDADAFRADRGTSTFALNDSTVTFFEMNPIVVQLGGKELIADDPVLELAIRNRLALWGARMLIPIHDNGRLLGLIALGVRNDGQPYDESDCTRGVFFARLLRHLLAKSTNISRLLSLAEHVALGSKYLPSTLVIGPDESVPRHVPLVVRDLIGRSRRGKEICRVAPSEGQPFRASAGIIGETGGAWAFWEEASGEVYDAAVIRRAGRRGLLRELALTLNHELGNALVSLATFRQGSSANPISEAMLETVKDDIRKLEKLNTHISIMHSIDEVVPEQVDIRDLAQKIGNLFGIRVEIGPDGVILSIAKQLLDFALRSLVETIAENRGDLGARELTIQVRSTGTESDLTALISLKGKLLELEGILPEPGDGSVPNLGRLGVFLAKEILSLHHGEIHAGPGLEGTEILISIRRW